MAVHERKDPPAENLVGTVPLDPEGEGRDLFSGPKVQLDALDADLQLRIVYLSHACLRRNCQNRPEPRGKASEAALPAQPTARKLRGSSNGVNRLGVLGKALDKGIKALFCGENFTNKYFALEEV